MPAPRDTKATGVALDERRVPLEPGVNREREPLRAQRQPVQQFFQAQAKPTLALNPQYGQQQLAPDNVKAMNMAIQASNGALAQSLAAQAVAQQQQTAALAAGDREADKKLQQRGGKQAVGPGAPGMVKAAASQMGTTYTWGGTTAQGGFDCSGLVLWAAKKSGVKIPSGIRTADQLSNSAKKVDIKQLKPGDLVFFDASDRLGPGQADHVAIYAGNGMIIDASYSNDKIMRRPLSTFNYAKMWGGTFAR
jgi:cell wall-associated NlpC family hydrolase